MQDKYGLLAVVCSLAFLGGCAASGTTREQDKVADELVENSLMQVANEIRDAQTVIANLGRAHSAPADSALYPLAELDRTISVVNWHGDIEVILSDIADRVGFRFERLGKKPAVAFIVHANYDRMTVNNALRDLSLQAGNGAQLSVDPSRRAIVLKYLKH